MNNFIECQVKTKAYAEELLKLAFEMLVPSTGGLDPL